MLRSPGRARCAQLRGRSSTGPRVRVERAMAIALEAARMPVHDTRGEHEPVGPRTPEAVTRG